MIAVVAASCAALSSGPAQAAAVSFALTSLGGQDWQYSYTVTNDGTPASIDEVSIYFDASLYSNLQITSSPLQWDSLALQPDMALPSAGLVDLLALAAGLAPGDTVTGLSVSFTFLGSGTPGAQDYDIVDPITFAVIESGATAAVVDPPPPDGTVPEPGAASLSLLALMGLVAMGRKRPTRPD